MGPRFVKEMDLCGPGTKYPTRHKKTSVRRKRLKDRRRSVADSHERSRFEALGYLMYSRKTKISLHSIK